MTTPTSHRGRTTALGIVALLAAGCAVIHWPEAVTVQSFDYRPDRDLKFSHDTHAEDCDTCHPGIDPDLEDYEEYAELENPAPVKVLAKDSCFECHSRGEDCAYCHERVRPDVAPKNHTAGFLREHGNEAKSPANRCDWCHGRTVDDCQTCHEQTRPLDHGGRWKASAHGRAAVHDRDRCWVCHRSDSCARCHSQPPETHTARFIIGDHGTLARRNLRSCYACHDFQRTCSKCHTQ